MPHTKCQCRKYHSFFWFFFWVGGHRGYFFYQVLGQYHFLSLAGQEMSGQSFQHLLVLNKPIWVDVNPTIQLCIIILVSRLNSHSQAVLADQGILVDREILLDQAIQHDFADFLAPLLCPEMMMTIPLSSLFLFQSMQAACLAKDSTPLNTQQFRNQSWAAYFIISMIKLSKQLFFCFQYMLGYISKSNEATLYVLPRCFTTATHLPTYTNITLDLGYI